MKQATANKHLGRWGMNLAATTSTWIAAALLGVSLSTATAVNVLTDPGLELGGLAPWSWNTWGGTSQLDTSVAHSGVNSWKFNGDQTAGAWNGGRQLNVPAQDTKFYMFSAWVNVPSASVSAPLTFSFRLPGVDVGAVRTVAAPGWTQVTSGVYLQPAPGATSFGYVGFHDFQGTMSYYVDDVVVDETDGVVLQGRVVNSVGAGVDGATVGASSPAFTSAPTTTAGGGYYTFTVPVGTYAIKATTPGYVGSTSAVVSGPTTAPNVVLGVDPDYDTDLVFSVRSSAASAASPWPCAYPASASFSRLGSPTVVTVNGQQMESNRYASGDGYRLSFGSQTIPCTGAGGATIVAVVQPHRNTDSWWSSIVNCYYNSLDLTVRNDTGGVRVCLNGNWYDGPVIPDGQLSVVSAVVAPDATIKVYVNGVPSALAAPVSSFTQITDGGFGPAAPLAFAHAINIGRNNPDAWTAINASLGDVYLYKTAIDNSKRSALEAALGAKFGVTITPPPTPHLRPMLVGAGTGGWRTDTYTIGTTFTTGPNPVTVTALGFVDRNQDGLAASHDIGIWDETGATLLASATVPAGATAPLVGDFRYATLTSPLTLAASTTYVIGAQTAGDAWRDTSANPGWSLPDFDGFVDVRSCYAGGGTLAFPLNNWGNAQIGGAANLIGSTDALAPPLHTITASAGTGGVIAPAGAVWVANGASQSFSITPNLGYTIADVQVSGVGSVGPVTSYTFNNVTADSTMVSSFTQLTTQTVSGRVTDGTAGVAGATVYFGLSSTAFATQLFTATTDGTGHFSLSLPPALWHVMANKMGYDFSADTTFTVASAPVTLADIVLTANPNWELLFSSTVDALGSLNTGDPTGNRATVYPVGGSLHTINTPAVIAVDVNGIRATNWEQNVYAEGDGYRFVPPDVAGIVVGGAYQAPIPADGVSVVAVVQPTYIGVSGEARGEILDMFYSELFLAVSHNPLNEGEVIVDWRGYHAANTGYKIANQEKVVLSLVVQPNGDMKLYGNGEEKWSQATGTNYSYLLPAGPNAPGSARTIVVGRNDFDGWSTFSGNIGDVYLYRSAITDVKRSSLEAGLSAKFGIPLTTGLTLPVPTLPGGVPTFDIPNTVSSKTYTLRYKDDLAASSWTSLTGTGTSLGNDGTLTLRDESTSRPSARFYQLEVQ